MVLYVLGKLDTIGDKKLSDSEKKYLGAQHWASSVVDESWCFWSPSSRSLGHESQRMETVFRRANTAIKILKCAVTYW